MASEDHNPGTNWTSGIAIFALALATGPYFIHRALPLVGSRPAIEEINIREPGPTRRERVGSRAYGRIHLRQSCKSLDKSARHELEKRCLKSNP